MNDNEFAVPDAIDVDQHESNGIVRAQFIYDGQPTVSVHLDQSRLLVLVAQLQAKIEHGSITPISRGLLQEGQEIEVKGASWQRKDDGCLALRLFAEVDGRHVSLPFTIPPEGVKDLREAVQD